MSGGRERVLVEPQRYLRAPVPVHFPAEAKVPETKRHLELRTLLYQLLQRAFADRAAIGCDQFVYWDPTDPRACLAPDAFVRWGEADSLFRSWKVWERGAPQVAVEIISDSDERDRDWEGKLAKYRRLGVGELVRFDPEAGQRLLRIWDCIEHDLVERAIDQAGAASRFLPGFWLVVDEPETGPTLRLSQDAAGLHLYPTLTEALRLETEARRLETEARRLETEALRLETEALRAAEQRVRELEAELRQRKP